MRALLPTLGNLAWMPASSADELDILDRFNGVPTLGIIGGPDGHHLFWRTYGYVTDGDWSLWLYIPIDAADRKRIQDCESDVLQGLVFNSPVARYATIGLAVDNRLTFEREWKTPAGVVGHTDFLLQYLRFLSEALDRALKLDLPAGRRESIERASRVVRDLVPA